MKYNSSELYLRCWATSSKTEEAHNSESVVLKSSQVLKSGEKDSHHEYTQPARTENIVCISSV